MVPSGHWKWIDFINGEAEECKWYEYEGDMKWLSKEFPTVLFTLKGTGEESGDLWVRYFKGGKVQTCQAKITFDEFDEKKLK